MQTLIIHPSDRSTDFLSEIYKDIDCLVVNCPVSESTLRRLIESHDKIMMMGHGTPIGLLGYGGYVIHDGFVDLLEHKPESVYIWCNADRFVRYNKLKGFFTGMIISEEVEAIYCGVDYEDGQVEASNKLFSETIKEALTYPTSQLIAESVKRNYLIENNPIVEYNNNNIYHL